MKFATGNAIDAAEKKLFNQSPAGLYKLIQSLQPNFIDDNKDFKPVPLKYIQQAVMQSKDLSEAGINNNAKINYRLKLLIETQYAKKVKIKRTKENFGSGTGFIIRSLQGEYPWKYYMKKNKGVDANELINNKGVEIDEDYYTKSLYTSLSRLPYQDRDINNETAKGPTGYLSPDKIKQYLRSWTNGNNTNPDVNFTPQQTTNYFKRLLTTNNFAKKPLIGHDKGQYVIFEIAQNNFENDNNGPANNENKFVKKTDASKFASGKATKNDFVYAVEWDGEPNLNSLPVHFQAKLKPLKPTFKEDEYGYGIMTFINNKRRYTVPFQGYVAMTGSGHLFGLSTDELNDKYVNVADAGQLSFDQISERIHKKREARNAKANTITNLFSKTFLHTRSIEASINAIEKDNTTSKLIDIKNAEQLKQTLIDGHTLSKRIKNNPDEYSDSLKRRLEERPHQTYLIEKRQAIGDVTKWIYDGRVIKDVDIIKKVRALTTKPEKVQAPQSDVQNSQDNQNYGQQITNAFVNAFNQTHNEKAALAAVRKLPKEITSRLDWRKISRYQNGLVDAETLRSYLDRKIANFSSNVETTLNKFGNQYLYRLQRGAFIDDNGRENNFNVDIVQPNEAAETIKNFKRYQTDANKW